MIAEAMVLTGPQNLERRRITIPDVGKLRAYDL